MFVYLGSRLTWRDLIVRTAKETIADDGLGLAAQLAYYFFLSLFPALLFLVALASYFPLQHLADSLVSILSRFTPAGIPSLVGDQLKFVQTINQKGEQLLELIMSLLDLSKLESGTMRYSGAGVAEYCAMLDEERLEMQS